MIGLALRYLLAFETTHTIVLGARTLSGYQDAVQALELPPLGDDLHRQLNKIRKKLAKRNPFLGLK